MGIGTKHGMRGGLANVGWHRALGIVALLTLSAAAGATTLADAVASALASNPRVGRADALARAADLDVRQARAGYFPSLDVSGGIGREDTNIKQLSVTGNEAGTLTRREFGLNLRQMLYDGFGTRSEVERRRALLDAAEHSSADVRESIAFQTVQVFIEVIRNRELVALAESNVDAHRRTLENVRLKVQSGVGQKADLQQAEGRLALARSVLTARQGSLRAAMSNYERVVGEMPGELLPPEHTASGLVGDGGVDDATLGRAVDTAIAEALVAHPAMQQGRSELDAAGAAISVARASYWPRVDLEGNLSRNANLAGVDGIRNSDTLMVVGRWNMFRGGADRAQEQASVERKFAAEEALADTERVISENVAIALKARATSESRIAFLEQHVKASQETLGSYKAQFDLGRRTLLDTLNAESELFTARSNLVSGSYDDLLNQYFVEAARGRLVAALGAGGAAQ
ncbi:MAG: TolC family outer membrane protein [Gammaproteobacteria bacterium]|nr:TolC family outer membrane protein [Gammaproteobacteria bacterium]